MDEINVFFIENARRGTPTFRRMCPQGDCRWKNIVSVDSIDEADFIIVYNSLIGIDFSGFPPERILYFTAEPDELQFMQHIWDNVHPDSHTFPISTYGRLQGWSVKRNYDQLKQTVCPKKTKDLSWVTTNMGDGTQPPEVQILEGHKHRIRFLTAFLTKYPEEMDLYGMGLARYNIPCYKGELWDKWYGLEPYRYTFAFENSWQEGYWTEKITDGILAGCMPIYWGCPDLEKYFPEHSFIRLDIAEEGAVDRAIEIIHSDFREQHLDELEEARQRLLDEYNIWPTMHKRINEVRDKMFPPLKQYAEDPYETFYGGYREIKIEQIEDTAAYQKEYGYKPINYHGKKVIDIGADNGSTASFFLRRGARQVVAVESSKERFSELEQYAAKVKQITPLFMKMENTDQFLKLLIEHKPDIVKFVCEGCEKVLLDISPDVSTLRIPETYIVEILPIDTLGAVSSNPTIDRDSLWRKMQLFFHDFGYEIIGIIETARTCIPYTFECTKRRLVVAERMEVKK